MGRKELLDRLRDIPSPSNPLLNTDIIKLIQLLRGQQGDFRKYLQALPPLLGARHPTEPQETDHESKRRGPR